MAIVIDHLFICVSRGAPEAEKLIAFGLFEGSPNVHPGQGTACRRFFFRNAMLELLWVEDSAEAQSGQAGKTRLWKRWSSADGASCPFGVILRSLPGSPGECPFPAWEYRPELIPELVLQIASDTTLAEPMWCYLEPGGGLDHAPPRRPQPIDHPAGLNELTGVRLVGPSLADGAVTSRMTREGLVAISVGAEHLVELEFDGKRSGRFTDFRPELPLILCS